MTHAPGRGHDADASSRHAAPRAALTAGQRATVDGAHSARTLLNKYPAFAAACASARACRAVCPQHTVVVQLTCSSRQACVWLMSGMGMTNHWPLEALLPARCSAALISGRSALQKRHTYALWASRARSSAFSRRSCRSAAAAGRRSCAHITGCLLWPQWPVLAGDSKKVSRLKL